MNASTPDNFEINHGTEKVVDLDKLDDLPLHPPTPDNDVVGNFDILRGQLDPEERARDFSSSRKPTEIMDLEVSGDPDSESEDHIIDKIKQARSEGDFTKAYELAKKIEDEDLLLTVVRGAVADLVDIGDYETAEKFIFLIKDTDTYTRELGYLLESKKDADNPLSVFGSGASNPIKKEAPSDDESTDPLLDFISNKGDTATNKSSKGDTATNIIKINRIKEPEVDFVGVKPGDSVGDDGVLENKDIEEVPSAVSTEREIPTAMELAMKRVDKIMADSATEPATPTVKVVPPIPTPEKKESIGEINNRIEETGKEYSAQYVDWKNQIRSKKSKFRRVLQDLGVDKQLPEDEEPKELVEARKAYIAAKKLKYKDYLVDEIVTPNREQRPLGLLDAEVNSKRYDLLDMVEAEDEALLKRISENLPPVEKGILGRGLDTWRTMPRYQRIAISSALAMTAGIIGGAGVGATAVYGGMRAGRAILGAIGGQGLAGVLGSRDEEKNAKSKKEAFGEYTKGIDVENFERKEKERMVFAEKLQNEKKRQTLKKGLALSAAVGVTNLGFDIDMPSGSVVNSDINLPGKGTLNVPNDFGDVDKHLDKLEKTRLAVPETLDSDNQLDNLEQLKPATEDNNAIVTEAKVELSSKGFLQDMHNLKAKIMAEYGGEVPDSLKPIMEKTPADLAKAFHFYDSNTNASGLGFKGEALEVDSMGNVYYEHLDGTKQVLFDAQKGEFHHFDGEMIAPKSGTVPGSEIYPNGKIGDDVYPKVDFGGDKKLAPDFIPTTPVSGTEVLEGDPIFKTEAVSVLDVKDTTDEEIAKQLAGETKAVEIPSEEPVVLTDENAMPNDAVSKMHIPLENGKSVEVFSVGDNNFVSYDGMRIGQEGTINGHKALVLDDNFQDGEQYRNVRSAFVKAFEADVKTDVVGPNPIAESFEGGKIYITYNIPNDPNSIKVLLNGKEIASGSIDNVDSKGIPKLKMNGNLKGGWFLVDNAYERAFKYINGMVKAGNFDFRK